VVDQPPFISRQGEDGRCEPQEGAPLAYFGAVPTVEILESLICDLRPQRARVAFA
jgi:hypothetical protein